MFKRFFFSVSPSNDFSLRVDTLIFNRANSPGNERKEEERLGVIDQNICHCLSGIAGSKQAGGGGGEKEKET